MQIITLSETRQWIKTSDHPFAKFLFSTIKQLVTFDLPIPKFILKSFYLLYKAINSVLSNLTRIFIYTPIFKGSISSIGSGLNLYGGIPYISGPVQIHIGTNCRISGVTTISGRTASSSEPVMMVGNNVDIGWMTTIAVGSRVEIGNNVRIAGRAFLAGYPGHPIDPKRRAMGLPDNDSQIGDVILDDDVWLATGVSVMAGVHIGHGTIVAAGSVVTHDLPSMVVAGGCPAKVIRSISPKQDLYGDDL